MTTKLWESAKVFMLMSMVLFDIKEDACFVLISIDMRPKLHATIYKKTSVPEAI